MTRSLLIMVCVSAVLLVPINASAARPERCLVVNRTSGGAFDDLQAAVDAAAPGDALKLKGTCSKEDRVTARGGISIGKNLTITGQSNNGFGPATVVFVPDQFTRSAVIRIAPGAAVTLTGLTITGGNGSFGGGGISVRGTLILNDSLVTRNSASSGGGIAVEATGEATLNRTRIANNFVNYGGGIENRGVLTLDDSAVTDNIAGIDGGGILNIGGTVAIEESLITRNRGGFGGGIANYSGTLAITGSAITANTAGRGGGIFTDDGRIALTDTNVTGNSACEGGGIYNIGSALTIVNSVLAPNTDTCNA